MRISTRGNEKGPARQRGKGRRLGWRAAGEGLVGVGGDAASARLEESSGPMAQRSTGGKVDDAGSQCGVCLGGTRKRSFSYSYARLDTDPRATATRCGPLPSRAGVMR